MPVHLQEFLEALANLVWGPPMLALSVGTGLFLTVRLRGLQFRRLWNTCSATAASCPGTA